MKKLLLIFALFLLSSPLYAAEGDLSVSPAKKELFVIAGQTQTANLTIFNETSEALTLELDSADFLPEKIIGCSHSVWAAPSSQIGGVGSFFNT